MAGEKVNLGQACIQGFPKKDLIFKTKFFWKNQQPLGDVLSKQWQLNSITTGSGCLAVGGHRSLEAKPLTAVQTYFVIFKQKIAMLTSLETNFARFKAIKKIKLLPL